MDVNKTLFERCVLEKLKIELFVCLLYWKLNSINSFVCSDFRVCNMREPEEEVHGGLDLHLHRARPHLSQPLQSHVLLHGQGGRDVPGSGESWHGGHLGF